MINKKHIGSRIYVKAFDVNIIIEDDPTKYKYYKSIGLERIFKKEKKSNDSTSSESASE